jgi:hypothetical protein
VRYHRINGMTFFGSVSRNGKETARRQTISQERTRALTRAPSKHASFCLALHRCQPNWHDLLPHRGSRVRQRTPNEAIKSTVDNNIRSFGWKLAPFHSPPARPQTFAVRMETDIPSAQP